MTLVCFATIISASSIGLVASALSKNSSVAMSFAPLLLVPQLLFSGMLFPLEDIGENISYFILCRFTVEGFGTINNLNNLTDSIQKIIPTYIREAESFYTFTVEHFFQDVAIIILMMVVLTFVCFFILKYQLERSK